MLNKFGAICLSQPVNAMEEGDVLTSVFGAVAAPLLRSPQALESEHLVLACRSSRDKGLVVESWGAVRHPGDRDIRLPELAGNPFTRPRPASVTPAGATTSIPRGTGRG